MTPAATVALVAAGVAAAVDWWAVATGRRAVDVLAGAVLVYAAVISAMVLSAAGTRSVLATLGAMAFAVSDWLLGFDRFVRPIRNGRVAVMVTYHTGQALLILGLALTG